ncbi:unnamed protein product [Polarella glacialis]|uniref:Amino acid transporter transmembrane domain-containing protein n=1 Tax=Polarella glacialis TaxID=89957 RepID=A0A813JM80_POLGL|nr:unnamed protein product [Polarella glacialis]
MLQSTTSESGLPAEPVPGDTVHVIGHGPAAFVEAVAPADGGLRYKVSYPDGTQDFVASKDVLVSEDSKGQRHFRSRFDSGPVVNEGPSAALATAGSTTPALPFTMMSPRGPRQLEYLGRSFDDSRRNIATPSATFSLVATMVGGGVLSLPYAMSQCGLVLGTICLLAAAVGSAWTLDMLVDCARATGRDSFELVGHAAFGEFSRKMTIALIFAICWLTKIAYFVLMADLLVPLAERALPHVAAAQGQDVFRRLVVTGAALLLSPMCFKSSLSALRFMCFASVGSVVVVGAVVGLRAFQTFGQAHEIHVQLPDGQKPVIVQAAYHMWPADWSKALYSFPMFGVSFLCHFNALPTHQELQRPTRYRMRMVIGTTLCLTSVIYLFVSICGYLYAGCYTCGNILLNFSSDDGLVTVGRGALGLVLMLNFPLICQPCRNAFFRLISDAACIQGYIADAQEAEQEIADTRSPDIYLEERVTRPAAEAGVQLGSPLRPGQFSSPPVGPRSPPSFALHVYLREDTRGGRGGTERAGSLEAFDTFMPKDATVQQSSSEPTQFLRCVLTAVLLGSSLLVSMFMKSIMVVWAVVGSTVCMPQPSAVLFL